MSSFQSSKFFPVKVADLSQVAKDVMSSFEAKEYDVTGQQTITGGWHISIRKGGAFKSVLGLKTALNIEVEPYGDGVLAKAGVGIFGQQALPFAVAMFIAWPVLITQIWGMVQQSNLDDEAMTVISDSLMTKSQSVNTSYASTGTKYCVFCGTSVQPPGVFCPSCGKKLA